MYDPNPVVSLVFFFQTGASYRIITLIYLKTWFLSDWESVCRRSYSARIRQRYPTLSHYESAPIISTYSRLQQNWHAPPHSKGSPDHHPYHWRLRRGWSGVPRPNTGGVEPINFFAVFNVRKDDFFSWYRFVVFFHGFPDLVISYLMAPNVVNRLTLEGFFTSLNPLHGVLIMIFGFLGENCIGI